MPSVKPCRQDDQGQADYANLRFFFHQQSSRENWDIHYIHTCSAKNIEFPHLFGLSVCSGFLL